MFLVRDKIIYEKVQLCTVFEFATCIQKQGNLAYNARCIVYGVFNIIGYGSTVAFATSMDFTANLNHFIFNGGSYNVWECNVNCVSFKN